MYCQCRTLKGTRCKNRPVLGNYCSVHRNCVNDFVEVREQVRNRDNEPRGQCMCRTLKGVQCLKRAVQESKFCAQHIECKNEVKHKVKYEAKHETKHEAKHEAKHEVKHKVKYEAKHETKHEAKHEVKKCLCETSRGTRCKNNAKDGSLFCGIHKACKNPLQEHKELETKHKHKKRPCNNDSDLTDENNFTDLPEHRIIRDDKGNCFTRNDLMSTFTVTNRPTNPFTNQPFWTDKKSFDQFISHPAFTDDDRHRLSALFYPTNLDKKVIDVIVKNPRVFDTIGYVGGILTADYGTDFKNSQSALAHLRHTLDKIHPHDKKIFEDMRIKTTRTGAFQTIGDILKDCNNVCIHGIGNSLLGIYLNYYMRVHKSNVRKDLKPNLIDIFIHSTIQSIILFPFVRDREVILVIYKYDDDPSKIVIENFGSFNYVRDGRRVDRVDSRLPIEYVQTISSDYNRFEDNLIIISRNSLTDIIRKISG